MNKLKALFAAAFLVAVSTANAASTIPDLEVDFRTIDWGAAYGLNSYTYDGVTISTVPTTKSIFTNSIDGIGILGGEPDEINPGEMMNVSFDYTNSWASAVTGIWITDLFASPDGGINGEEGIVELTLAGGSMITYNFFGNNSHQANGEQYIDFGTALEVTNAHFKTNGVAGNEFSIAGFTAVPEASSLAMLSLGFLLMGLGFAQRRKQA